MNNMQGVLHVHHETVTEGGESVITRITPYIRIADGKNGRVFLKSGLIVDENGVHQDTPAPWMIDQIKKLTPKALEEIGFTEFVHNLDKQEKRR